jgi:ceramide glucosyltransferase
LVGEWLQWVAQFCLAAATVGCVYTLFAALLVLRLGTGFRRRGNHQPSVTVLKPLCGREPDLLNRLAAFGCQDYSGPVQIVCGSQHRADPAIDVVKRLKTALPDSVIDLAVDPRAYGSNRKISNLINMAALAQNEIVVLSDSDIEVGPSYLSDVVAELQQPGVGAVTCLYHGVPTGGLWSRLSAMAINTYFLPNVVVAHSIGLAHPCFGATIALRRETLDEIGGFHAFADCLADDYAIGQAVRANGAAVRIPSFSVGHVCFEQSAAELLRHQMRQARTIRSIDPAGYAGAIISHPFALAMLGALLGSSFGLLVAAFAVVCRTVLTMAVERAFGLPKHQYWLLPFRDTLAFAAFVSGFLSTRVSWRGSRYRVLADGSVVQESN